MKMEITAMGTVGNQFTGFPNGKPNEDAFDGVTPGAGKPFGVFVVVDGVSRSPNKDGLYPDPSPSANVAQTICDSFMTNLKDPLIGMSGAFQCANTEVLVANATLDPYFRPGAVACAARFLGLGDGILELGYIGDPLAYIVRRGAFISLVNQQTISFFEAKKQDLTYSARETRSDICNNPAHLLGYGVLDGNPDALHFVEVRHVQLLPGDMLIMASDGFEPLFNSDYKNQLLSASFDELVKITEKMEDLKRLRSDDKTLVRVKF